MPAPRPLQAPSAHGSTGGRGAPTPAPKYLMENPRGAPAASGARTQPGLRGLASHKACWPRKGAQKSPDGHSRLTTHLCATMNALGPGAAHQQACPSCPPDGETDAPGAGTQGSDAHAQQVAAPGPAQGRALRSVTAFTRSPRSPEPEGHATSGRRPAGGAPPSTGGPSNTRSLCRAQVQSPAGQGRTLCGDACPRGTRRPPT